MASISQLINVADAYKQSADVEDDSTVSYRVFRDSKKLTALRSGNADITVRRFNAALVWFDKNWPVNAARPSELLVALSHLDIDGRPPSDLGSSLEQGAAAQ